LIRFKALLLQEKLDHFLQVQNQFVLFQQHRKVNDRLWLSRARVGQRRDVKLREGKQILKSLLIGFAQRAKELRQFLLLEPN
jgi:tRNA isopentenyl-2-thiomethyl-A-37 hydroxylase MiaE